MENIKSVNIQNIGVNLEKIGDLLYHEGPLLSLFQDRNKPKNYYIYKWSDSDEQCNRWLVFPVSTENLRGFLYQELSLKNLIFKNSYVFLIDINNEIEQVQCLVVAKEDIPTSYLPRENSFYKQGKYTELAEKLRNTIVNRSIYDVLNHLISEVETIKKEQKIEMSLISQLLNKASQSTSVV